MSDLASLLAQEPLIALAISVLAQATVLMCGALLAAWLFRHNPAARAGVLTSALVAGLACPPVTAVMWCCGVTLIPLPLVPADGSAESVATISSSNSAGRQAAGSTDGADLAVPPGTLELSPRPARGAPGEAAPIIPRVVADGASRAPERAAPPEPERTRAGKLVRAAVLVGLAVWMLGGILCGVGVARSWWRLRDLLRASRTIEAESLQEAWCEVRRLLRAGKVPRILGSSKVSCPVVAGVLRPAILLPTGLCEKLSRAELRTVLLHEAAHVVRRDQLVLWLQQWLAAIFWPHPLVHLLNRELVRACDDASDNYVLRSVDGPHYGRTLLRLAKLMPGMQPAAAMGLIRRRRRLEQRVSALLDERRKPMVRMSVLGVGASVAVVGMLLVVGGGTVVIARSPTEEPAGTDARASANNTASFQEGASSPRGEASGGTGTENTKARSTTGAEAQTQRVRALIYVLRQHRVFSRCDEWGATIRELVEIGKPAVPELVAELDRTDRGQTLRALGFTLRAIGDPRAVPALIRAIPKTLRPPGSDCGLSFLDADLHTFMQKHDRHEGEATYVSYGRPVNEILGTLEKITGHREPSTGRDKLRHVFLRGTVEEQAANRQLFQRRMEHWQWWWSEHWQEFVTQEQLHSVKLPERQEDVVALAGLAEFGPLFPTGSHVRLGAVHEARIEPELYWNAKSHIDFDTGRVYENLEAIDQAAAGRSDDFTVRIVSWRREMGIDARHNGSMSGEDLHLWLVENRRWDTLEEEIRSGRPMRLGREATDWMVPFGERRTDFQRDQLGTFLFTTREGGRGIVQVVPRDEDSQAYRLRYRMMVTDGAEPPGRPAVVPRTEEGPPLSEPTSTTLEAPAPGSEFLLDLESGRTYSAPDTLVSEYSAPAFDFRKSEAFAPWCRDRGVDLAARVASVEWEYSTRASAADRSPGPTRRVELLGLDMVARRVLPQSFDEMSVEDVREIVGRLREPQPSVAWMARRPDLSHQPDTFAIKTRDGGLGVLEVTGATDDLNTITIRYRLHRLSRR